MHPRTVELLNHLDAHRTELLAAVDAVPVEIRTTRPDPSRWSVTEVLEHLSIVETRISGLFRREAAKAEPSPFAAEVDLKSVMGSLDVNRLLDRSIRLVSGDASLPPGTLDADAALTILEQERSALRDAVAAADGVALGDVTFPHPRMGPLNMYQWVVFLGAHEGRHALQIREIAAELGAGEGA